MIIGISKSKGLKTRYSSEGTKYTRLKYDVEGQGRGPVLETNIPKNDFANFVVTSEVARPVTVRLEDTQRVAKMLAHTTSGYRWEAKTAAALAIQNRLNSRIASKYAGNANSFWKDAGKAAITAATLAYNTLEQVAVAGTGVRITPFKNRSYVEVGAGKNGNRVTKVQKTNNFFVPEATVEGSNVLDSVSFLDKKISDFRNNSEMSFSNTNDISKVTKIVSKTTEQRSTVNQKIDTEKEKATVERKLESNPPIVRMLNKQGYRKKPGGEEILKAINTYESGDSSFPKIDDNLVVSDPRDPNLPYIRNGKILYGLDYSKDMRDMVSNPTADLRDTPDSNSEELELSGLIPFYISSITPNRRVNCFFEANLDSYSENYTGNWENIQYIGRADNSLVYSGFDRKINFSFKVVAKSQSNLLPIYNSLNYLVGTLAPTYDSEKVFMRGTMVMLRIGDMLIDQTGVFTGISLKWDKDVPWEIVNNDNGRMIVPHVLTVDASFTPVHEFVPTADSIYFGDSKQILNQNSRK